MVRVDSLDPIDNVAFSMDNGDLQLHRLPRVNIPFVVNGELLLCPNMSKELFG